MTGWSVEARTGSAADLHGDAGEASGRTVRLCEVVAPAVVLGSTQPPEAVDREAAAAAGVAVVRRRSGGGAVLVAPGAQVWVEAWLPSGDPLLDPDVGRSFLWFGEAWRRALADLGVAASVHDGAWQPGPWGRAVCFAGRGPGEVLGPAGAKLVGLAQRRTRAGARFQSSALLRWEPERLVRLLALDDAAARAARRDLETVAAPVGVDPTDLTDRLLGHLPS